MRAAMLAASFVAGCSCGNAHLASDGGPSDGGADASPAVDAPSDAAPLDAGPVCLLTDPTADVAGTTPLGPVAFEYGWAGLGNTSKACFGVALHFTESPELWSAPGRSMWMWLPRPSAEPILGTHVGVTITLELDGTIVTTDQGLVNVTAYTRDPVFPAVEAMVDVVAGGWDVHGRLTVPYCDLFRDPCI